jgi:hypothetical protein
MQKSFESTGRSKVGEVPVKGPSVLETLRLRRLMLGRPEERARFKFEQAGVKVVDGISEADLVVLAQLVDRERMVRFFSSRRRPAGPGDALAMAMGASAGRRDRVSVPVAGVLRGLLSEEFARAGESPSSPLDFVGGGALVSTLVDLRPDLPAMLVKAFSERGLAYPGVQSGFLDSWLGSFYTGFSRLTPALADLEQSRGEFRMESLFSALGNWPETAVWMEAAESAIGGMRTRFLSDTRYAEMRAVVLTRLLTSAPEVLDKVDVAVAHARASVLGFGGGPSLWALRNMPERLLGGLWRMGSVDAGQFADLSSYASALRAFAPDVTKGYEPLLKLLETPSGREQVWHNVGTLFLNSLLVADYAPGKDAFLRMGRGVDGFDFLGILPVYSTGSKYTERAVELLSGLARHVSMQELELGQKEGSPVPAFLRMVSRLKAGEVALQEMAGPLGWLLSAHPWRDVLFDVDSPACVVHALPPGEAGRVISLFAPPAPRLPAGVPLEVPPSLAVEARQLCGFFHALESLDVPGSLVERCFGAFSTAARVRRNESDLVNFMTLFPDAVRPNSVASYVLTMVGKGGEPVGDAGVGLRAECVRNLTDVALSRLLQNVSPAEGAALSREAASYGHDVAGLLQWLASPETEARLGYAGDAKAFAGLQQAVGLPVPADVRWLSYTVQDRKALADLFRVPLGGWMLCRATAPSVMAVVQAAASYEQQGVPMDPYWNRHAVDLVRRVMAGEFGGSVSGKGSGLVLHPLDFAGGWQQVWTRVLKRDASELAGFSPAVSDLVLWDKPVAWHSALERLDALEFDLRQTIGGGFSSVPEFLSLASVYHKEYQDLFASGATLARALLVWSEGMQPKDSPCRFLYGPGVELKDYLEVIAVMRTDLDRLEAQAKGQDAEVSSPVLEPSLPSF